MATMPLQGLRGEEEIRRLEEKKGWGEWSRLEKDRRRPEN